MIYTPKMATKTKTRTKLKGMLTDGERPEEFKKYDALKAYAFEGLSAEKAGKLIGFNANSFRTLVWKVSREGLDVIKPKKKGPKERHKAESYRKRIVDLRKRNLDSEEIAEVLNETENANLGPRTVTRVLREEGFKKIKRRSAKEKKKAKVVMEEERKRSRNSTGGYKGEMRSDNPGIFLFAPVINELGLPEMVEEAGLYGTKDISSWSYFLSFMALKLVGAKRLSKADDYTHDGGMAFFTGLTKIPSGTALHTYSYNLMKEDTKKLMKAYGKKIKEHVDGKNFNLDFHSIPHFGESEEFENNYVPTRGKAMKSALAFFAQDQETTIFCYSDADVKNEDKDDKILEFVSYWKEVKGEKPEHLIFDSKVTTYPNLLKLAEEEHVKFVTLRRRGKKLMEGVEDIPKEDWRRVHLKNVKRKYRNLRVADRKTDLRITNKEGKVTGKLKVRELVITNNGRDEPTFMITTDEDLSTKDVIELYAPRWRIENGISEEVDFFNLNALSSTPGVKVDFDVIMTQIASGLYKLMAKDLWSFEKSKSETIYDKFVKGSGGIHVLEDKIIVELPKKKHTPLLRDAEFMKKEIIIPWLGNRKIEFIFV